MKQIRDYGMLYVKVTYKDGSIEKFNVTLRDYSQWLANKASKRNIADLVVT